MDSILVPLKKNADRYAGLGLASRFSAFVRQGEVSHGGDPASPFSPPQPMLSRAIVVDRRPSTDYQVPCLPRVAGTADSKAPGSTGCWRGQPRSRGRAFIATRPPDSCQYPGILLTALWAFIWRRKHPILL